ncbi:MAG TPA: molybdopterin cofactor-binding domain-containing protein [Beijerinckiaceae bacterium]|jgi:CO/xanthine dehydrogenase Mo-binding subunit/aerobic-type carbon monoxide dehydrogenase small subunit (CoxS/CutS family)
MTVHQPAPGVAATTLSLTLNGESRTVEACPFETLADVLRDRLNLTGTKIGCNAGDCGACTVLLDGRQACACLVPAAQAHGAEVHTVEGPGPGGVTERLRRAFLVHGAAQCGICTPGMLMAAADLLVRTPAPSRAEVEDALGGVLCRCTGYVKIVEAVMAAAIAPLSSPASRSEAKAREGDLLPAPPSGEDPGSPSRAATRLAGDDSGYVGTRIPRLDGWAKVAGTERFGADETPAEALWLRVVRSPHARAAFAFGDLEAFRAERGLAAVVTAADVPGENSFGIFPDTKDQPVFAEDCVRFRGEAVLGLVGTREALGAIEDADVPIVWTPLPPLEGIEAALADGAPALHASRPDNVLTRGRLACGDPERAHERAAATAEGAFRTAFVEHAYIEPEAGFAAPTGPGSIEVTACTQAPYMDRDETARVLGLPPQNVRIRPSACGGGFGGKLDVSVQPLLAVTAWKVRRPVRMVYSRVESMASTTKRHPAAIRARAAADADGRLLAFTSEADFNTGAYASWGPTVANRVPVHASGPYRVANVRNLTRAVYTNDTPAGAFRGFGVPQAAIAHECLMDDLAETLRIDRWAIRRLNALSRGDRTPSGQLLAHSAGLPQCLDALKGDWDAALARAAAHNSGEPRHRRGAGIACMWYGCGNTALPNPSTMRIALARDGTLAFLNGAVDIGQGSTTVLTQIAADALGVPPERFTLVVGDTGLTADAGKTSASRQTFVSGKAAMLASQDLRRKILGLANVGAGASLALDGAALVIAEGEVRRTIDLASLPADQNGVVLDGVGTYDPPTTPLDADGQGIPYATYGFAAQIAEVEVDTVLATVKVLRIAAAHDVGRAVNPTLVEGQIHGGIAQGLGLALMEEFVPGRTENLHDYLIPTVGDMPDIVVRLIEDPEPEGPFGAKGVGEPALIATAPAILSAIRHATGVVIREVPVLPHRLWAALRSANP